MSGFVRQNACQCAFTSADSWVILNPIEQSIKRKIEAIGTPLKDWDIKINRGILTGCNEAFIIDQQKRDELVREDPKSAELIRPILRGRDIKRYSYEWAHLYILAMFPALHIDIEQYPAVKRHLLSFGIERLEQTGKEYTINGEKIHSRKKTGNKWFETQDQIGYWDDFSRPKIIYPNMTKYLPFFYDDKAFLTNQKCFIITGEQIAFLTAFFNSSLFKFCYTDSFPELQGGTHELSKIFFDKISVPSISEEKNNDFRKIVQSIQAATGQNKKNLELIADTMIFDILKLTEDERKLIGFIEIH